MVFVLRVFDVAVGRVRAQRFAGLPFGFEHSPNLSAGVLGIELIENVDERGHVIFGAVDAVHAVVDGDEADVGIGKDHLGVHTDLQIISAQP